MDEGLGIRRDGPGERPHPAAGGTSGGTMWLLRPDGGLDRPDHPLFMGARRVGRGRPGAAVIVDLTGPGDHGGRERAHRAAPALHERTVVLDALEDPRQRVLGAAPRPSSPVSPHPFLESPPEGYSPRS